MSGNPQRAVSNSPINTMSQNDSVPQDEYRSQVVDVLANTMNNCLAELGYHPDFTQQLQTIHEWNIRLRNENAKLFQDNKKLAQLIGMQNERISKTVPNIPLNQGVADLQIRLQAVELNRQELLNQHHAALEEIGFLRQEVARLNRMLRVRLTSTSGSSQVPVQTQVPPQTHIPVHTHISQTGFLPMYDGSPPALPGFYSSPGQQAHGSRLRTIDTSVARSLTHQSPTASAIERMVRGYMLDPGTPVTQMPGRRSSDVAMTAYPPAGPSATTSPNVEMIDLRTHEEPEPKAEPQPTPQINGDVSLPETLPQRAEEKQEMQEAQESDLIQDCIDANFVEKEDEEGSGRFWCRMCRSRHQAGISQVPPEPFMNASRDSLIQHCEAEHPSGWERLKQAIQEQEGSD